MGKIREAEKTKKFWAEFYSQKLQQIVDDCDMTIQNMTSMLETYFASVPHKVTKTQENYALPSGKLVFKKQAPDFERDDQKIIAHLKESGQTQYITTREVLNWGEFKKTLSVVGEAVADENGEVLDCIKAVERPDVFKVELKEEKENGDDL